MTFSSLEAERLNRGLSLRAAARAIGVGKNVLERAEEGEMPRPDSALKIADFYGFKVTDIWPVDREPHKETNATRKEVA